MASIRLGDIECYIQVKNSEEKVTYPNAKKIAKFKRHLQTAENIAFLPGNKVIVADKMAEKVQIYYSESGKFSSVLTKGIRPMGIATTPSGMVAVVDKMKRRIKVYSSDNGDIFSQWGDEFNWKPKGITFSNKGHIIVTDVSHKAHSVGVYTQDGIKLRTFGSLGPKAKHFNNPCYVTVDMFDRIIVSDRDNHAVKIFNDRGTLLGKIGGYGSNQGKLSSPRGICTDNRGNIVVCDTGNKRVCIFSLDGRHIQDLLTSHDGIGYPFDIAYTRESNLLAVAQHISGREGGHVRKVCIYQLERLHALEFVRQISL